MIIFKIWVADELIKTYFTAQNWIFLFSEIFPIVISIVLQKWGAQPQNSNYI